MSGHTSLFMTSFNVSRSVTLAGELKLAVTIARCKWASQVLSNILMISSSSSCLHLFSGSFLMKSLPLGGSLSGDHDVDSILGDMLAQIYTCRVMYGSNNHFRVSSSHTVPVLHNQLLKGSDTFGQCIFVVIVQHLCHGIKYAVDVIHICFCLLSGLPSSSSSSTSSGMVTTSGGSCKAIFVLSMFWNNSLIEVAGGPVPPKTKLQNEVFGVNFRF